VPYPPGGMTDILARIMAQRLTERLGQQVVVDNRPGAGNNIGTEAVVRATPDGYTVLLVNPANAINATLYSNLSFNFLSDMAPVAGLVRVPNVMEVTNSLPVKSIPEFITYAKANPGKVILASSGSGTSVHLSGELFKMMAGVDLTHVPYKGAGPAVIDLVGARIHVFVGSVTGTQPQVSAGRIRAIATGHIQRLRSMPEMPTVAEVFPGFSNDGWYGIVAPARTPATIINKLNSEMKRALANAEFSRNVESIGMEPASSTPEELREWIRSELARWTKVVRDAGIQMQGG